MMNCMLCGEPVLYSRLVTGYHDRCAKVQKYLEEKYWPDGLVYDIVYHLYKKYGLRLSHISSGRATANVAGAIRNHWLVCMFLERYPNIVDRFLARKEVAFMYYGILAAAEVEFLGHSKYTVPKELEICLKASSKIFPKTIQT